MRVSLIVLIILLTTLSASVASAQDFRQAMLDMQNKYKAAEDMRIRMTVEVFNSKESESALYRENVLVAKKSNAWHYRLSSTDMIMNDNYIIVVDHLGRRIILNDRDLTGEASFYKQVNFNIDSMLRTFEPARYEGRRDSIDKYTVFQKKGQIQEVELYINSGSSHLHQINYLYKAGQWVTISFDEFELSPVFDKKEFDEQQFVQKNGQSWTPTATLASYRVIKANDNDALKK